MSIYKEASKIGLRVFTSKGSLTVEQLWTLSMNDLTSAIKAVKKQLVKENDDELSFLDESATKTNPVVQLTFDILKDIYLTKKEEALKIKTAADTKAHNQKILALISEKKDGELAGKSIAELEAMLK